MSREHGSGGAPIQVYFYVTAGNHGVQAQLPEQPVDMGHDGGRAMPFDGVGTQRVADLAHGGSGGGAVTGDVADDDAHDAVVEGNDVVPVAADLHPVSPWQVPGGVA